jgi:hypothetical protein
MAPISFHVSMSPELRATTGFATGAIPQSKMVVAIKTNFTTIAMTWKGPCGRKVLLLGTVRAPSPVLVRFEDKGGTIALEPAPDFRGRSKPDCTNHRPAFGVLRQLKCAALICLKLRAGSMIVKHVDPSARQGATCCEE